MRSAFLKNPKYRDVDTNPPAHQDPAALRPGCANSCPNADAISLAHGRHDSESGRSRLKSPAETAQSDPSALHQSASALHDIQVAPNMVLGEIALADAPVRRRHSCSYKRGLVRRFLCPVRSAA